MDSASAVLKPRCHVDDGVVGCRDGFGIMACSRHARKVTLRVLKARASDI